MLILIGDRILLTNLDFQLRNAKITRFWNRVVMVLHLFSSLDFGTESLAVSGSWDEPWKSVLFRAADL